MWHSGPPRDPPLETPLHGKCHLKFPFWFFDSVPKLDTANDRLSSIKTDLRYLTRNEHLTELRHSAVLWCVSNYWVLQSCCKKCLQWRSKTLLLGNSQRKEVDQWTKQSLTHLTTHLTIQFDKLPRDTTWYISTGDNGKKCLIQYQPCTNQCNHVCNKSTSPLLGLGSVLHAGNAKIFHHFGCYPMLTSNQIMMIGPCHQQRLRREDLHKQGSEPVAL